MLYTRLDAFRRMKLLLNSFQGLVSNQPFKKQNLLKRGKVFFQGIIKIFFPGCLLPLQISEDVNSELLQELMSLMTKLKSSRLFVEHHKMPVLERMAIYNRKS